MYQIEIHVNNLGVSLYRRGRHELPVDAERAGANHAPAYLGHAEVPATASKAVQVVQGPGGVRARTWVNQHLPEQTRAGLAIAPLILERGVECGLVWIYVAGQRACSRDVEHIGYPAQLVRISKICLH